MNRYDPDRPSIFSKPDVESAPEPATPQSTRAPEPAPYGEDPTVIAAAWRPPRPPRPPRPGDATEAPDDGREPISRQVIVLGSMGIAILALGGFIAASMLRPTAEPAVGAASLEPSPTATAVAPSATASIEPRATEAPTEQPTPQPTPAGPPQELAVDGWATVTVGELNVRNAPGLDASSVYRLVRGAIAHVAQGPTSSDGYDWYRVASLGGATGWATSGTQASPFMRTVTRGGDLVQCGQVTAPVFAAGTLTPVEVIRIGDMALPPTAFEPGELGGFALARGTNQEVCITAVRGDPSPAVYVEMSQSGCGHPVVSGDRLEFHPMAGMDVVAEYQHKDVVRIHPAVLDPKGMDDALTDDMIAILHWMSLDPRSWGCLMQGVHESPDREVGGIQLDIRGCGVIESQTANSVTVRAAAGTDQAITLTMTPDSTVDPSLPFGVPVGVIAWGFDDLNMRSISLAPYDAPCP